MKSIISPSIILIIMLFILQSCKHELTTVKEFQITGKITGLDTGKVKLVKLDLSTNEAINVDSTILKNGIFIFKGKLEKPYLHTISIENKQYKIHLFLENSNINVAANIRDFNNAKVSGSREDSLFRSVNMDDIFDRKKGMKIMMNYPDYVFSAFTAYYQFQIHNIHADTLRMIINSFDEPVKNSLYYTHLTNLYNTLDKVAISKPAPSFYIPDVNGDTIKLADFKGKFVLIDFWASWCGPCREANPKLVEVYQAFDRKLLEIVGISIDKEKVSWLKAIKDDRLPWINVSNLEGWDIVSDTYGVKAVPQNFLIDPNGIIVKKNLDPDRMIETIERLIANE